MRSPDHESESALPGEGWILYDGGCRFCFGPVHFCQRRVEQQRLILWMPVKFMGSKGSDLPPPPCLLRCMPDSPADRVLPPYYARHHLRMGLTSC